MKLHYFSLFSKKLNLPNNFGDELNPWIFKKLMPKCFIDTSEEEVLFVGIGTLLGERIPNYPITVVFGSGTDYDSRPKIDAGWKFYCVRGPLTAQKLGLDKSLVVSDSAYLLNELYHPEERIKRYRYSFMPHFDTNTLMDKAVEAFSEITGFHVINPLDPVEKILEEISSSEILISQAMHGAIVADALRVPWIPVVVESNQQMTPISRFKWRDWCSSIDIQYAPVTLPSLRLYGNETSKFEAQCQQFLKLILNNTNALLSSNERHRWITEELHNRMQLLENDYFSGALSLKSITSQYQAELQDLNLQQMSTNEQLLYFHTLETKIEHLKHKNLLNSEGLQKQKIDTLLRKARRKISMNYTTLNSIFKQRFLQ